MPEHDHIDDDKLTTDGTLPEGWAWTTVEELYRIVGGGTPSTQVEQYWNGDTPWITSADIHGLRNITPQRFITREAIENSATNLVPSDSIIVVTRVGLGKLAVTEYPLCFSQDSQALIDDTDFLYPAYMLYYLSQAVQVFRHQSRGTTIAGVTKKQLALLEVPLAPLNEQRRIVEAIESLFTQLDAGVAALKRLRANLRRYKAAVLKAACEGRLVPQDPNDEPAIELLQRKSIKANNNPKRAGRLWGSGFVPELTDNEFQSLPDGWVWAKVKDLGNDPENVVQVGPMSMKSSEFEDEGVAVLNVGCVQWGYFDETKLNYLPAEKATNFARYRILEGDVLFTRSGTVGRSAVAQKHQNNWLMTFHLLRVRASHDICLPEYLQIVFEGAAHIRRQTKDASIGTTRAGFNTRLLAELDVPLPPLEEQNRIVAEVERYLSIIKEQSTTIERNLKRAERLRQSVLKRAFAGQLVPQDPNDEPASELLKRIRRARGSNNRKTRS